VAKDVPSHATDDEPAEAGLATRADDDRVRVDRRHGIHELVRGIADAMAAIRRQTRRPQLLGRQLRTGLAGACSSPLRGRSGYLLLVLGLLSFGFIAMLVYVLAGPDGTEANTRHMQPV
jgi:hypothetical protein